MLDESPADEVLHTEEILVASIEMIERNIFRTFTNKSKCNTIKFLMPI